MPAVHRPGHSFLVIGQEEPVAVAPGQIHRRVAPGLGRPGRRRLAGLDIGIVGGGQAVFHQPRLAALDHPVEGGQVLTVFDGVFGALEDLLYGEVRQGFQPQLLDLAELAGVRIGGVVLVVIIEAKQGEDLVDGLDVSLAGWTFWFSLPSWCR